MNKKKILTLALCLSLLVSCFAIFKEKDNMNVYALTGGNPNYSLEGAVYQVYTKDSNGNFTVPATDTSGENAVFVTDAEGNVEPCDLKVGEYQVREITPSKGYLLDPTPYPITIKDGETASFTSIEMPTAGYLPVLYKESANGKQGWRAFLGAEYTLRYYAVDPATTDITGAEPEREWVFGTKEMKDPQSGKSTAGIDFAHDTPIKGDEFYAVEIRDENDYNNGLVELSPGSGIVKRVLPIGVFTIEETKAPKGLARNTEVYYGNVLQPALGAHAATSVNRTQNLISGSRQRELVNVEKEPGIKIIVNKVNAQTGQNKASKKYATLAGAEYEVYYDDPGLGKPELVGVITTDENGYGELTKRELGTPTYVGTDLDLGNYLIKETKPAPGFVIDKYQMTGSGEEVFKGEIEVICGYDDNGNPATKTIKGTYEDGQHLFTARAEANGVNLLTYTITSKDWSTETHIKKTDITTTKELPGATLQVLNDKGEVLEEWVSTDKEHIVYELPVGTYTLREITAPYGYDVAEDVKFTIEENKIVHKVEMQNKPIEIGTTALDVETESHHGTKSETAQIKDVVKVKGVTAGRKYKVKGYLIDQATGAPLADAAGNKVESESAEFTATGEEAEVELTFTVNTSMFTKQTTVVAFERLYRTSAVRGEAVPVDLAKHEDPNDEAQTIRFGGIIRTIATDKKSLSKNVLAGRKVTIVDTVEYENLSTEETYTLEGDLYDKTTGKVLGKIVRKDFKPETPNGTVTIEFTINASKLEGHSLVAFEKLWIRGKLVDSHENPDDKEQTVYVPKIRTIIGKPSGKKVVDTVKYKNLIPGETYVMRGWFVNKTTGLKIKGSDGEKKFKPETRNGSVDVTLNLAKANGNIVAYEECYIVKDGKEYKVGEHKDRKDKKQSLVYRRPGAPSTGENMMIFGLALAFMAGVAGFVVARRKSAK